MSRKSEIVGSVICSAAVLRGTLNDPTTRRVPIFSGISRPQGRCEWYRIEHDDVPLKDVRSITNLLRTQSP
jgi:hypothetical protein